MKRIKKPFPLMKSDYNYPAIAAVFKPYFAWSNFTVRSFILLRYFPLMVLIFGLMFLFFIFFLGVFIHRFFGLFQ